MSHEYIPVKNIRTYWQTTNEDIRKSVANYNNVALDDDLTVFTYSGEYYICSNYFKFFMVRYRDREQMLKCSIKQVHDLESLRTRSLKNAIIESKGWGWMKEMIYGLLSRVSSQEISYLVQQTGLPKEKFKNYVLDERVPDRYRDYAYNKMQVSKFNKMYHSRTLRQAGEHVLHILTNFLTWEDPIKRGLTTDEIDYCIRYFNTHRVHPNAEKARDDLIELLLEKEPADRRRQQEIHDKRFSPGTNSSRDSDENDFDPLH
ncbi:hypothetical protein [Bacillus fonticola]|uniref:hypothetical protein n=1 Tax=Bacillus fonticola TaxID=2728853 RepID=UPI0014767B89|nr:hypothetical protein [Bacillus fonticola]